ncbi:MAG: hypothetical protein WC916_07905 [Candidatus Woesearchaeota archaeon]
MKYHWDDEKLKVIFSESNTADELKKKARELYSSLIKEEKIEKGIPFSYFFDAFRKRGIALELLKDHHKKKNVKYPWVESELKKIFSETHSYEELRERIKVYYDLLTTEKKLGKDINFERFFIGLWSAGKRREFVRDYHHSVAKKKSNGKSNLNKDALDRIEQVLQSGILEKGKREFISTSQEECRKIGVETKYRDLSDQFLSFVWTKDRLQFLKDAVRHGHNRTRVYAAVSFIPKKFIDAKIKELRGAGNNKRIYADVLLSESGVGRLTISKEIAETVRVDLEKASIHNPFQISVSDKEGFAIPVINAALVGTEYSQILEENIVRNVLELIEQKKDEFVLLPGGLMLLDVKKSEGFLTTHRARGSGLSFNPATLETEYRNEAIRLHSVLPPDKVVFERLRERFLNLASGWRKIVVDKNGSPVFSGKVYITFGRVEEEIIESATHAEIGYIVYQQRQEVINERHGVEAELRLAYKNQDYTRVEELEKEVKYLVSKEKRMIQSNVSTEDRKRFFEIIRAWTIKTLEKTIPNSKVITQGTAFTLIGGKSVEIHQDREQGPTVEMLDNFLRKNSGRRVLDKTLPDLVLLVNSFSVNYRLASVRRPNLPDCLVVQLPVALNKQFLLDQMRDIIRKGSPIEKLLRHEQFEPGMCRIERRDGLWIPQMIPISALLRKPIEGVSAADIKRDSRYAYIFLTSDEHIGHPWKMMYYNKQKRNFLGHDEAVMEILRREFLKKGKSLPIHAYIALGDQTQGHHFPTQSEPHENLVLIKTVSKWFNTFENIVKNTNGETALKELKLIEARVIKQIILRGKYWPQYQILEYLHTVLEENADFFSAVIKRGTRAGVTPIGINHFDGEDTDSRSIGLISEIGGNHFQHTIDGELNEAFFYAEKIIDLLLRDKSIKFTYEELTELVRAPIHGNTSYGQGILKTGKDGYEWGISLRHEPSRKSGANGDPLREAAKNVIERGDFTGIFSGRKVIHISGDIHRFGAVQLSDAMVLSVAAGTGGDPYGQRGFSPNNVGNMILGIPARGPEYGPLKLIIFTQDFVTKYFNAPWEIDWDRILSDPL